MEKVLEIIIYLNEKEKKEACSIYNCGIFHLVLPGRVLFCCVLYTEEVISLYILMPWFWLEQDQYSFQ